ncbi:MAG: PfkB family carbohydrate kinase, partial [Promethearchaeia archaeon]
LQETFSSKICFLGLDGYVDSFYSLVKSRKNPTEWTRMDKMSRFGQIVQEVAGSSANIERVLKKKTSGGFAPNTAKAINGLGITVNLVGAIGYPEINPMFSHLTERDAVNSTNFSDPGETLGLEFDDGKIMLTDFANVMNINWDILVERVGLENLIALVNESDLMGFGHWSLLPHFNEIWTHMMDQVFPEIEDLKSKLFFVDLADIKKRSAEDIRNMLDLLTKIDNDVPVMLSLNDQESIDITKALDSVDVIDPTKENFEDYVEGGKEINEQANLSYLVVHSPHFATITLKDLDHYWVTEGYTSTPQYTTGAGDHFHAGTAIGICCELEPAEALLLGNSLTAIFVRTGESPNFSQLLHFTKNYMKYIENDIPTFPNQ